MLVGNALEPLIPALFVLDHPSLSVSKCGETWMRPEWPDFVGHPDFLVHEEAGTGVLEAKTSSHWLKREWEEGRAPEQHICQLQWQLAFRDEMDFGWICAFLGNADDETPAVRVGKDPVLIRQLQDKAHNFMECVRKGTPPSPSSRDSDLIRKHLGRERISGKLVDLPWEQHGAKLEQWKALQAEKKTLNERLKAVKEEEGQIENEMGLAVGQAEAGACGPYLVRWDWYRRKAEAAPRPATEKQVIKIKEVR